MECPSVSQLNWAEAVFNPSLLLGSESARNSVELLAPPQPAQGALVSGLHSPCYEQRRFCGGQHAC
eukprot:4276219-Amphidinium_carterae.1